MSVAEFLARWRVRLGYPLAALVLWLARPTPRTILYGALVGVAGLLVRARAAGYLHKQEILTVTGPYAYTRNPLYLGSAILALGVAIATWSWPAAAILCAYFALVYSVVMRREEQELRAHHGAAFDAYAQTVPLFLPRLTPANPSAVVTSGFSFAQYRKNHEYQAAIGFALVLLLLLLIWYLRPK